MRHKLHSILAVICSIYACLWTFFRNSSILYTVKNHVHSTYPPLCLSTRLIVYWACQGTQTGEFLGMAASGRVEAFNGVHVLTVDLASGRIKATDVFRECAPTEELYKRNVSWNAED